MLNGYIGPGNGFGSRTTKWIYWAWQTKTVQNVHEPQGQLIWCGPGPGPGPGPSSLDQFKHFMSHRQSRPAKILVGVTCERGGGEFKGIIHLLRHSRFGSNLQSMGSVKLISEINICQIFYLTEVG